VVRILADSINPAGDRLITVLIDHFPYCLLQEINTHRGINKDAMNYFSRNSASTRAMSINKMIEDVKDFYFEPTWIKEQKGMQGDSYDEFDPVLDQIGKIYYNSLQQQIENVIKLSELGVHKSKSAKLLGAYLTVNIIATGNYHQWQNFGVLRTDSAADIDLQRVAKPIMIEIENSKPVEMKLGDVHCPFGLVDGDIMSRFHLVQEAVVRIAKLSFDKFAEPMKPDYIEAFYNRLVSMQHYSPFEHICIAADHAQYKNLMGFMTLRNLVELKCL